MYLGIHIKIIIIKSYWDREGDYRKKQNRFHNWIEFLICKGIEKDKKAEDCNSSKIYKKCLMIKMLVILTLSKVRKIVTTMIQGW